MFNDSLLTGIAKKKTDPHEYHVQCTHTDTQIRVRTQRNLINRPLLAALNCTNKLLKIFNNKLNRRNEPHEMFIVFFLFVLRSSDCR